MWEEGESIIQSIVNPLDDEVTHYLWPRTIMNHHPMTMT